MSFTHFLLHPWRIRKSMRFKKYLTKNPSQTKKLGEKLVQEILNSPFPKETLVLGLKGDLGGGKTTFLQGFAKGLGIKEKILSPTFIILKKIKMQSASWRTNFKNFYHIDCYRIEKPRELLSLGFKKIITNPQNVVAIEWADRIDKILPAKTIIINFEFVDQKTRKITIGFKK